MFVRNGIIESDENYASNCMLTCRLLTFSTSPGGDVFRQTFSRIPYNAECCNLYMQSFLLTERSRSPTVVNYLLCSRCCLGSVRTKDPYWAHCCTFSTQLRWMALVVSCHALNLHQYADDTHRPTLALRPATLRQPSHISLRVSSTSRLG